jgi:hypothetical protein
VRGSSSFEWLKIIFRTGFFISGSGGESLQEEAENIIPAIRIKTRR